MKEALIEDELKSYITNKNVEMAELELKVVAQQARIDELRYYLSKIHSVHDYGFEHTRAEVEKIINKSDDLSALKEHDAKLLEEAALSFDLNVHDALEIISGLHWMAAEKRG